MYCQRRFSSNKSSKMWDAQAHLRRSCAKSSYSNSSVLSASSMAAAAEMNMVSFSNTIWYTFHVSSSFCVGTSVVVQIISRSCGITVARNCLKLRTKRLLIHPQRPLTHWSSSESPVTVWNYGRTLFCLKASDCCLRLRKATCSLLLFFLKWILSKRKRAHSAFQQFASV